MIHKRLVRLVKSRELSNKESDVIPDSRNMETCLNCNRSICTGKCDLISNSKGRPKKEHSEKSRNIM